MIEQLEALQRGALVKRYHSHPVRENQNIGHHSHSVAMLLWMLTGGTNAYHLMAALTHDLGEQETGDIPAPAKRALGIRDQVNSMEAKFLKNFGFDFGELSENEQRQLKLADALDGMLHCVTERMMGNRFIESVYLTFVSYARRLVDCNANFEEAIFNDMQLLWSKANESE